MESHPTPLSRIMGAITNLLLVIAMCCLLTLPWSLRWFVLWRGLPFDAVYYPMLFLLLSSGICAVGILWQMHRIFQTINRADPFVARNVHSLRVIGWLCGVIAAIYAVGLLFIHSPFLLLVLAAFAFLAAFLFLLADLLRRAVQFKEENELTI